MYERDRIGLALLLLRVSIFIVMLVWTLDKFINPGHAAAVYEKFYLLGGLGKEFMYGVGAIELIILAGFISGAWKRITYGTVLALHTISTLASYKQYLAPYDGANILFFAAWPMLAACITLYLLRDRDTLLSLKTGR
ncbi:MAG: hypothetical protein OEN52_01695 [Gammaproteobacteria bacterium]|nr:hypothetical protein [Gammaproteobacteria bacterium]